MPIKTYEILTPVQTQPGQPAQSEGMIELDSVEGGELVKLGALRAVTSSAVKATGGGSPAKINRQQAT